MVTVARPSYTVKWKLDVWPHFEEGENELAEYAVVVKLTTSLINRSIMKFEGRKSVYYVCYVSSRQIKNQKQSKILYTNV